MVITQKQERFDPVNRPKHYQSRGGIETIDVIAAFTDGLNGIEATDTGNILKYACRWKEKNGIEDVKKLIWYANHLLTHLEEEQARAFYANQNKNETELSTNQSGK